MSSYQDAIAKIAPEIEKYGGYISITPMKEGGVSHRHDMDPDAWRLRIQDHAPSGGMSVIAQGSTEDPIDEALLVVLEEFPNLKLSYFELDDSKSPLKGNKLWEDFTSALQEAADEDNERLDEQRQRAAAYPDDAEEVDAVGYLERSVAGLMKLKSLVGEAIDRRNAMQAPGPR